MRRLSVELGLNAEMLSLKYLAIRSLGSLELYVDLIVNVGWLARCEFGVSSLKRLKVLLNGFCLN